MDDLKALKPQKFWVDGHPNTNHRPRISGAYVNMDSEYKSWRDTVSWHALAADLTLATGQVILSLRFFTKTYKASDCDNLAKGVTDALQGIGYADDKQVYDCFVSKRPPHPERGEGVDVMIMPCPDPRVVNAQYTGFEQRMLAVLDARIGEIVSYKLISRHIWDYEDVPNSSIFNLVSRLRAKGFQIETLKGVGLRLIAWPEGVDK